MRANKWHGRVKLKRWPTPDAYVETVTSEISVYQIQHGVLKHSPTLARTRLSLAVYNRRKGRMLIAWMAIGTGAVEVSLGAFALL